MIKEKMSKTIMEIGSITETFSVIIQMYIKSSSIFPWKARKSKIPGIPKCGILLQVSYKEIPVHLTLSLEETRGRKGVKYLIFRKMANI